MDMGSRLTEKEVEDLGLVKVDWETIRDKDIKEIYIRAYPDSPMYGPYKVIDADEQIISKMDGTEQRTYPRDKGLYVGFIKSNWDKTFDESGKKKKDDWDWSDRIEDKKEAEKDWRAFDGDPEDDWNWGEPIKNIEEEEQEPEYIPGGTWYTKDEKGRIILDPANPDHTKLILEALLKKTAQEIYDKEIELEELYSAEEALQIALDKLE